MVDYFYRDRSVSVTGTAIRVGDAVYRFDQLTRVWHRRARRSWRALAGRGALGLVLIAPLGAAGVALVVAMQLDISGPARLAVVVAAVLLGLAVGPVLDLILDRMDHSFDRGLHVHEIWAERNGVDVRLLQTRNAMRFGRIYRALQRAVDS